MGAPEACWLINLITLNLTRGGAMTEEVVIIHNNLVQIWLIIYHMESRRPTNRNAMIWNR